MKDGELTRAGRAYESASGIQLSPPAPWGGDPFLVGNNQWINVTGHGRKLLSSFIRGREKLTSWGRRWYKEHPEEYVVQVPVQISYRRRDGSTYKAPPSTLPISWHTNLHQQDNRWNGAMLEHIRSKLPDHYTTLSIYEIEVLYDQPPRDWTVSRKRVTIDADGRVRFEAAIDQPLRGYDGRQSFTPKPDNIIDQAFRSGEQNCVIEQLLERFSDIDHQELVDHFHNAAVKLFASLLLAHLRDSVVSCNYCVDGRIVELVV